MSANSTGLEPTTKPTRTLVAVSGGLLLLTLLMVASGNSDLGGGMKLAAVMLCAGFQALLVGLYFTNLGKERGFYGVVVMIGILVILLFAGLMLIDTGDYQPDVIWRAGRPAG